MGGLLLDRLPWTLGLLGTALVLSTSLGTALGLLAGWVPGSRRDRLLVVLAAVLSAVPEFLVAIGLLLVFAITLRWFPLSGGQTLFVQYGAIHSVAGRARWTWAGIWRCPRRRWRWPGSRASR